MAQENGVTLEFIGKQLAAIRDEMKGVSDRLDKIETRLDGFEHTQRRFQVRMAIMETRDRDTASDLAAIARIIEAAGLVDD